MTLCAAIDLDDCLANLGPVAASVLARATGIKIPYQDWWTHNWLEMYNVPQETIRAALVEGVSYEFLELLSPKWIKLIAKLQDRHILPVFVTARGNVFPFEVARRITCNWLNGNNIRTKEEQVIPVIWGQSKAKTLKELGFEVFFSADDYLKEVRSYQEEFPNGYHVIIDSPILRNSKPDLSGVPKFDPKTGIGALSQLVSDQLDMLWRNRYE